MYFNFEEYEKNEQYLMHTLIQEQYYATNRYFNHDVGVINYVHLLFWCYLSVLEMDCSWLSWIATIMM